ncbi:hypothetical protein [Siphonobacter sp. SORGH_AS_0500]|uniref:hypothetical protein n=1 Tax=Siphonobacter sp. SORGH_AS_0500 TaxID=1864824 RepID=UPI00285FCC86|nr:hypothetical protein [Siphonobacter sp. SORGH_AS_0500]MDR6195624.1 hypothetical protein [Siphonobacter sp. SORGH_AS_0500]
MKKIKDLRLLASFVAIGIYLFIKEFVQDLFTPGDAVLGLTALTGLRRKVGGAKPGGNKRLYIAPVDWFQDQEFPTYEDGKLGEITGTIPLILLPTPMKFIELQCAYDSTKFSFASKGKVGSQSFEQNITFKINRMDKQAIALVTSLLNVPCVIIARGMDNINYVIGNTEVPLELEISADSGAKGSDEKFTSFTCKNDGYMHPVVPLGADVVFPVEALPAA